MMARSYFQTTLISEEKARSQNIKNISQENKILDFFSLFPSATVTAEDIQEKAILHPRTPITSIRRALCNLERKGKIQRVRETTGRYNMPIGVYGVIL